MLSVKPWGHNSLFTMEDEQDWLLNAGNLYFDQGPHSDFAVARLDYV